MPPESREVNATGYTRISPCNACPLRRIRGLRRKDIIVVTNGETPDLCPGSVCKLGHLLI